MALPFKNEYLHRTAEKDGPCFVCSKPSSAVLTTDSDWFFVCLNHISDTSFCKPIVPLPPKTATVVQKDSMKMPAATSKAKDPVVDSASLTKPDANAKKPGAPIKPEPPAGPKKYLLTTSFFYLREKNYKKKAQTKQASQVLSQLSFPAVPKSKPQ